MAVKAAPKGNLVDEWKQGNVRVRVYDDAYTGKSQEEIQKVMKRIYGICWEIVEDARAAGKEI